MERRWELMTGGFSSHWGQQVWRRRGRDPGWAGSGKSGNTSADGVKGERASRSSSHTRGWEISPGPRLWPLCRSPDACEPVCVCEHVCEPVCVCVCVRMFCAESSPLAHQGNSSPLRFFFSFLWYVYPWMLYLLDNLGSQCYCALSYLIYVSPLKKI